MRTIRSSVEVIKGLYRKDPKIAIGMEMFQRPFQPVLDDYINGAIEEREFLKKSEYFQRWNLDYNLYKPILDFARAEKIPVIALNLRREIVEKVSKSGMDALTGDERKEIPAETGFFRYGLPGPAPAGVRPAQGQRGEELRLSFIRPRSSGTRRWRCPSMSI